MTVVAYTAQQLLNRFVAWSETNPDIRTVLLIGSHARIDHVADQWSDLDLLVTVTDAPRYLNQTDWLEDLGTLWTTHLEPTPIGNILERRALFEGAIDVDFVFVAQDAMPRLVQTTEISAVLRRGVRTLIDKDRMMSRITLPLGHRIAYQPPTQAEFLNVVNDFWFHAVWTTKKLRRGELWTAKLCLDSHMKNLVLKMMEWHTHAVGPRNYDTWFNGRFVEEWADPHALEDLRYAFAYYDANDLARALGTTMDLFRALATETAAQFTYPYPFGTDAQITAWVSDNLS